MAHFAKLDRENKVTGVYVVNNEVITDGDGVEQEQLGIDFLNQLFGEAGWYKQTSYNGTFRKNFAGINSEYSPADDAFIHPQPYSSWVLNATTFQWEAPTPYPADGIEGKVYLWNEATTNWVEVE